jgi:RNase P protein component
MKPLTANYVFRFLRRRAKKYLLKSYLVWFLPWEKTIVHVSLSRKTGSAVFRNRIRRILKGHCAALEKLPRGIYIFKGLVGCSIAEARCLWVKLLNLKAFTTYSNKHITYNDYQASNHKSIRDQKEINNKA